MSGLSLDDFKLGGFLHLLSRGIVDFVVDGLYDVRCLFIGFIPVIGFVFRDLQLSMSIGIEYIR